MRNPIAICVISVIFLQNSLAQKIDNLVSFRDINSANYFRFNYDNDYFAASDKNYTQGYSFELVSPFFESNPINHLLYKPKDEEIRYGLAVEHLGYTPNHYEDPDIQFGIGRLQPLLCLKVL